MVPARFYCKIFPSLNGSPIYRQFIVFEKLSGKSVDFTVPGTVFFLQKYPLLKKQRKFKEVIPCQKVKRSFTCLCPSVTMKFRWTATTKN